MTTTEFDLYGLSIDDIENAKVLLESILSVEFERHYSNYKCGDYYLYKNTDTQESFTLQKNYDEFEDEWIEDDHRKYSLLFYVDDTNRSKEIAVLFKNNAELSLLRHQELES